MTDVDRLTDENCNLYLKERNSLFEKVKRKTMGTWPLANISNTKGYPCFFFLFNGAKKGKPRKQKKKDNGRILGGKVNKRKR